MIKKVFRLSISISLIFIIISSFTFIYSLSGISLNSCTLLENFKKNNNYSLHKKNSINKYKTNAEFNREIKYPIVLSNKEITIKIFSNLKYEIYFVSDKTKIEKLLAEGSNLSFIKLKNNFTSLKFVINERTIKSNLEPHLYGNSKLISFKAFSLDSTISINFTFIIPQNFDNVIICRTSIENISSKPINIEYYEFFNAKLDARFFGADSAYKFWTFQGGSYPERYDWIFPLSPKYFRENYQGMNAPDYGGGIPVVDFWTKENGIAFASIDKKPQLISLPVKVEDSSYVSFSIKDPNPILIKPGESFNLVPVAIISHSGDYFNALNTYSKIMHFEGFSFPVAPKESFEPEWCAWGYGRNFNKEQILKSLPIVKKLGFKWVTLDDGWQNANGDWQPNFEKFPGGENDFIAFIDTIHSYGLKVRLWWVPFDAQDSSYNSKHFPNRMNEYGMKIQSKVALEHPDWFLLDKEGNRVQVSWWNSFLLCPAYSKVKEYFVEFLKRAILNWKIDGFKMDGQNLNAVPECFNPMHNHEEPLASYQGVPEFFKTIYDEALKLKSDFVLQSCPCGTNFSIYNLPFVNQTVASDPLSSWQVRLKGKTYKALFGNRETYSGDHVELTNRIWDDKLQKFIPHGKEDFASTLAVGGVPASKFTVAGIPQSDSSLILDSSKYKYYERWMQIYNTEKMSEGKYLNLYDIAFDKPETHLIKKETTYFYSFFSDDNFDGKVHLRGLKKGVYKIYDLFTGKFISSVNSKIPFLKISFKKYLIIKAIKD